MKIVALVIALLTALPMSADRIIVPAVAHILYGADGSTYGTNLTVTNLAARHVTVRVAAVYAAVWRDGCAEPVERTLAPAETQWISLSSDCRGVLALELESDGPVRAAAEITTLYEGRSLHIQNVDVAREWLPANREAILPTVLIDLPGANAYWGLARTNLFVVNPNDTPLRLDLRTTRRSESMPSCEETHTVAPKSVAVLRIAGLPDRWCEGPRVADVAPYCTESYDLTVRADAPYFATASSVHERGDARFTMPAVLGQE